MVSDFCDEGPTKRRAPGSRMLADQSVDIKAFICGRAQRRQSATDTWLLSVGRSAPAFNGLTRRGVSPPGGHSVLQSPHWCMFFETSRHNGTTSTPSRKHISSNCPERRHLFVGVYPYRRLCDLGHLGRLSKRRFCWTRPHRTSSFDL